MGTDASRLWANRSFRYLWVSQAGLGLGDAMMRMGLLEVFRRCQLSVDVETAKMFFALSVPGLVLGPLAMAHVDRWPRRWVMITCDSLRAVLMGVMVWWVWRATQGPELPHNLRSVHALIFGAGVIVTFYLPARYALVPNLVEGRQLVTANTALTASLAIIAVAGMPLGGLVATRLGPLAAILLNGIAYAGSIVWLSRIHPQPAPQQGGGTVPAAGDCADGPGADPRTLKAGLSYLVNHPMVIPLVAIAAVFAFLAGILAVTVVGYATETLELGTVGLGCLGGALGVGGGIGMALLGPGKPWTRSIWLPPGQLVAGGLLLAFLSAVRNPWLAGLVLLAIGAVSATAIIPIDAKLQAEVEDSRRGAVFAARGMMTSATMMIAFWVKFGTSLLRTTPPPVVLVWSSAAAMGVAGLTALALYRRQRG